MAGFKLCPECGVPRTVSKHNIWLTNGTILEDNDPNHRVVFVENDSLRDTFGGIEKILGISIEHIIVESQRRSTYESVTRTVPAPIRKILNYTGTGLIARYLKTSGLSNGKGAIEVLSTRRRRKEDDYIKLRVRDPFSLAHFCGNAAGAIEAVDGREVNVTYEETSPGEYELTVHWTGHPKELQERLQRKAPRYKPGDIELPRCGTCGVPAEISDYAWSWDRGVIENKDSGRRMIIVSTATQDAIMDELVNELGESVTEALVEAQRGLVASGFFSSDEIKGVDDYRTQFAYRGLGNLVEIEFVGERLLARIENPCLNPMVVGLIQGLFDGSTGGRSDLEWKTTSDGDLVVDVRQKK